MKSLAALTLLVVLQGKVWFEEPPLGLETFLPVPETNPLTREKILRGRELFFDKRLSRDGALSCATCHDPQQGFSDGRAIARGVGGVEGTRNASALINRGYGQSGFWDGRVKALEDQVLDPIFNPNELGLTKAELERRAGMPAAAVAAALASYIRTIRSGDSPYDRYASGQADALNALEKDGLTVFRGKGNCAACHAGPNFTDEQFRNTGVAWRDERLVDEGRFTVTKAERDRGAFKTPTLRDLTRTAPYMHDGSIATLEDVVEFYSNGGRANPNRDSRVRKSNFTAQEKTALIAFLRALTGRIQEGAR